MDLALEMGQPVGVLTKVLEEREFNQWMRYARQKMLPTRRLELHLAQIALVIARTMGSAKNAKLSDFLFDRKDNDEPMMKEKTAGMAFVGVRKLGQGRKPKVANG